MKTKLTLGILLVILMTISIFLGCTKDQSVKSSVPLSLTRQDLSSINNTINSLYEYKKNLILNFENREKISVQDVFSTAEIKNAVRYKFLDFAEFGSVKGYSNEVKVLNDEIIFLQNGEVIVPSIERVQSYVITPDTKERVNSGYTDKFFFKFNLKDGKWELENIQILNEEYDLTTTKYDEDKVHDYITTDTQMLLNSKESEEDRIQYEIRKINEAFFDKKIDVNTFDAKLHNLYEQNNLLPNQSLQSRTQSSLNKANAVTYATTWTDSTGGSGTSKYNNKIYKVFSVGNDCANFASQCLIAGGWKYESPYTNYSNHTKAWWYNNQKTDKTSDDACSETWASAEYLCQYICVNNKYAAFTTATQVYAGTVGLADLMWQPATGTKNHVMIVTNIYHPTKSTTKVKYSAHSNNRLNKPWESYDKNAPVTFGHFN